MRFITIPLLLTLSLFASDTKHLEMDYGDVMSTTVQTQWPQGENMVHKGLVQRLSTLALPAKGTPVGKGRFIKEKKEAIANTENDLIYQYQRERSTGYLIALPKGEYKVTLQFAEIKRKSSGERVFDIVLQEQKIKEAFDPFKESGGQYKAIDIVVDKVVVDNFLRLDFVQKSTRSTPAIAGIIIEGKDFTQKINCGGKKKGDYQADWSKSDYMDDPFTTGVIFDTELLCYSAVWKNGFVKLKGTAFDATHGTHPEIQGKQIWGSGYIPGWHFGEFPAVDKRPENLGHLPKEWAHYKGMYRHEEGNILAYTVGESLVLDNMSLLKIPGKDATQAYVRTVQGNFKQESWQLIVEFPKGEQELELKNSSLLNLQNGMMLATLGLKDLKYKKVTRKVGEEELLAIYVQVLPGKNHYATILYQLDDGDNTAAQRFSKAIPKMKLKDLSSFTSGGAARWPQQITTQGTRSTDEGMLTIDEIVMPENNPWRSWMRPGAFDFFADGKSMAVSTWSGDVWVVSNLDDIGNLRWKRFAAGLFHPLGLKIVDEKVYVQCRDQISILHDLNKDGEADYYQNFNNDVVITANFHEFSFDLQRDKQGNFYFVKGAPVVAGGEGFGEIKKHHGCLFKVSPDGERLEVIATGFRAPNGMGMSPDGQLTTSDNEGNWVAATPINWIKEGGFYGVMPTAHRKEVPKKRNNIVCWIPHEIDNSAGGQVWIPKGEWGDLGGEMLHISYGQTKLFHLMKEEVGGLMQGGVIDLKPSGDFDAGIMRGRFNNKDKALYLCGLKGWQTKGVKDGGIYRVRYTAKKECRPIALKVGQNGLKISFTEPVDELSALDAGNYELSRWVYEISEKYGSRHYKVPKGNIWNLESEFQPLPADILKSLSNKKSEEEQKDILQKLYNKYVGEDQVEIKSISLSADKKTVFLEIPDITPVMQMKVSFEIQSLTKKTVKADIHHTIHKLGQWRGQPGKAADSVALNAPKPGIVVKYMHLGQQKSDTRVQRQAAFYIDEKTPLTQFLDHGLFDAHFDGFIKADRNMKANLYVAGTGNVTVSINGQVQIRGPIQTNKALPVSLKKGFNKIHLEYKSPERGVAVFRLYWESLDYFPKEPIPATSLFHEGGQKTVENSLAKRRGLELALQNKCFACHADSSKSTLPELQMSKISLDAASERLNPAWISQWVKNPRDLRPTAHMPQMLKSLPESQWEQSANDIAAFLSANSKSKKIAGDSALGKVLYGDLGCASCHVFKDDGLGPQIISLKKATFKFKAGGMAAFIANPQKFNHQSAMPNFGLSNDESQNLEAFIRSQLKAPLSLNVNGDARRGEKLFTDLNCQSCHSLKDIKTDIKIIDIDGKSGGCLVEGGKGKPYYSLKGKDKKAIESYLSSVKTSLKHFQPAEYAQRQLKNLNCLNCHSRDGLSGNWQSPHKTPQALPPTLTHVGEKITNTYLQKILSGEAGKMRSWQKSRMPAFKSQAENLALGLNQLSGFSQQTEKVIGKEAISGKTLSLQTGFSCNICHAAGNTAALAPFGAPGLNLKLAGERLRHEYYMRWMLNPKRVEPSTHMLRFSSDHKTTAIKLFDNAAQKQFNAVWDYMQKLNDE
jgi:mono/diheme cytochrome c family protein